MRHKVARLDGLLLDQAVAEADGDAFLSSRSYCEDWACGGPIIARELIDIQAPRADGASWVATTPVAYGTGRTPLIAAMRCFVASKVGDEIDLIE